MRGMAWEWLQAEEKGRWAMVADRSEPEGKTGVEDVRDVEIDEHSVDRFDD